MLHLVIGTMIHCRINHLEYNMERNFIQDIRNSLAEGGVELTPAEVEDAVRDACSKVRIVLKLMGWSQIPETDAELLEFVKGRL